MNSEVPERRVLPSSFLLPWLPFLVPPLYLAAVFWLQPADRLGDPDPEERPRVGRLLYDDYDAAARALRGLNASLGRTAGRTDEPPWLSREDYRKALDESAEPPQPDPPYFLEYPHAALLMFRLGYVFSNRVDACDVPTAVRDGDFHNLVEHEPRDNAERRLWRHLRWAIRIYAVVGTVCLLGLMVVLRVGYEPGGGLSGPVVLLILPASLYFAVHRFDVVPALLTALSLACLGRRWIAASGVFLGAATMVKVYPVLLALLMLRYLSADRRALLTWAVSYAATVAAILAPPLVLSGWPATWGPYRFQLSRPVEIGWSLYVYLLPEFLGEPGPVGSTFRIGTMLAAIGVLCWSRPADLTSLLRRGVVVLMLFVSLQVFYSPQWMLWFSPFLVPLAAKHRSVLWLAIALDLVTYLSFPVVFDLPSSTGEAILRGALVYARAGICAALVWVLLRAEFKKAV